VARGLPGPPVGSVPTGGPIGPPVNAVSNSTSKSHMRRRRPPHRITANEIRRTPVDGEISKTYPTALCCCLLYQQAVCVPFRGDDDNLMPTTRNFRLGYGGHACPLPASESTGCMAEMYLRWAQPLCLPLELFCFFATFTHEPLLLYIFGFPYILRV